VKRRMSENGLGEVWVGDERGVYLEKLIASAVDDVCRVGVIDTVLIRCNANDRPIFAM